MLKEKGEQGAKNQVPISALPGSMWLWANPYLLNLIGYLLSSKKITIDVLKFLWDPQISKGRKEDLCIDYFKSVYNNCVSLTHKREDPEVSCQAITKKDLSTSKGTEKPGSQVDFCGNT